MIRVEFARFFCRNAIFLYFSIKMYFSPFGESAEFCKIDSGYHWIASLAQELAPYYQLQSCS